METFTFSSPLNITNYVQKVESNENNLNCRWNVHHGVGGQVEQGWDNGVDHIAYCAG